MTLSILIPIYNENVTKLVEDLCGQARKVVDFEILCFDDGSNIEHKQLNRPLGRIEEVRYEEMDDNQGRSRIRNLLADAARAQYLLFMDGDSKVIRPDYVSTYVNALSAETLLYGGRCYEREPPADKRYFLHWLYGTEREQQPVAQRIEQPYHSFMTNNFLMPAALFHTIRFDECLTQYGHEDTLFGMALRHRKIPIRHLDNPLEHAGLEVAEVFLAKARKAVENLQKLSAADKPVETRLLKAFRQMKRWGLAGLYLTCFDLFEKRMYDNLMSNRPSLRVFDFYKLGLLARMDRQNIAPLL